MTFESNEISFYYFAFDKAGIRKPFSLGLRSVFSSYYLKTCIITNPKKINRYVSRLKKKA